MYIFFVQVVLLRKQDENIFCLTVYLMDPVSIWLSILAYLICYRKCLLHGTEKRI